MRGSTVPVVSSGARAGLLLRFDPTCAHFPDPQCPSRLSGISWGKRLGLSKRRWTVCVDLGHHEWPYEGQEGGV